MAKDEGAGAKEAGAAKAEGRLLDRLTNLTVLLFAASLLAEVVSG